MCLHHITIAMHASIVMVLLATLLSLPRCYRYFASAAPHEADQPLPDDEGTGDKGEVGDDQQPPITPPPPGLPPASEGSSSESETTAVRPRRPEQFLRREGMPPGTLVSKQGDVFGPVVISWADFASHLQEAAWLRDG